MSENGTSSYAPKSPDLSSFCSTPAQPSKEKTLTADSTTISAPAGPAGPAVPTTAFLDGNNCQRYFNNQQGSYLHAPQSSHSSAWTQYQSQQPSRSFSQPHCQYIPPASGYIKANRNEYHPSAGSRCEPPRQKIFSHNPQQQHFPLTDTQLQQHPSCRSGQAPGPVQFVHSGTFPQPYSPPYSHSRSHSLSYPPSISTQDGDYFQQAASISSPTMPRPRSTVVIASEDTHADSSSNGPVVRTRFPTARIKRIMQADEEVGKVAQSTPIAVGKALELFMIQLVTKSADLSRQKGSKRVSSQHLREVIEGDDQWDFLRDIASRAEDNEKRGKSSKTTESDEEAAEGKRKGRGRKKKMG